MLLTKSLKKYNNEAQMLIINKTSFLNRGILLLLLIGCSSQKPILKVGMTLPKNIKSKCSDLFIMASSGQLLKGLGCNIDNKAYEVILNQKNGHIDKIITRDKQLILRKNISISSTYSNIKQYETNKFYQTGWGYLVDIGLPWKCGFWDETIRRTGKLSDTSQIKFFIQENK
jgi:hypothetical protein